MFYETTTVTAQPVSSATGAVTLLDSHALEVAAARSASSSYLDRQYPVPDRDSVEGYGLLGFAGSWRVRDGLTLRARLDNLTDKAYETLIGFPGPGRSFWVGLGWARP